ncbi:hypothetical protein AsAng_0048050 [Aureispira anguillae]|uniref:Uncharacterized protein n=1 Tax=Aureispira anguillae TaxID=2864201 RepID=A0A915YIX1_9BACT|nr:hypothetical protein AsAng_0048050 [Aureispira anguillae]
MLFNFFSALAVILLKLLALRAKYLLQITFDFNYSQKENEIVKISIPPYFHIKTCPA